MVHKITKKMQNRFSKSIHYIVEYMIILKRERLANAKKERSVERVAVDVVVVVIFMFAL